MKSFRSFITLAIIFFWLLSCGKVEVDANSDPQGYADSQVVGQWKITAITSNTPYDWDGDGVKETDIYSTWSDCTKDNLYVFDGTKTGIYRISCSITKNGTWQMVDRHTLTFIPEGYAPNNELIISLTSNEFHTVANVIVSGNQLIKVTKTWSRQ